MTTQPALNSAPWPVECDGEQLERFRHARDLGVQWLVTQIGRDGEPSGAEIANSWWRAPWALNMAGAPEAAARMLGWIERNALTPTGALRPGPFDAPQASSPVYHLSPIAIAAWQLGRYDLANAVMGSMMEFVDPDTGGVYELRDFASDPVQDTLATSQLGISALVTGQRGVSDGVAQWLDRNLNDQPELPTKLYTSRREGLLVTTFPDSRAFFRVVDFEKSQQAYFQPGIAAAFLTGHYQQTGHTNSLDLARRYLQITTSGGDLQFDDPTSVQICKFGWGVATTYTATSDPALRPWVVRMGEWFTRRQRSDGSWAPATFTTPKPGLLDYYWKTAEHVMELSYIVLALEGMPLDHVGTAT